MSDILTTERRGPVLVLHIDDGKANALSPTLVAALDDALTTAEHDADIGALCIVGRDGKLCAGFDLTVMASSVEAMRSLVGDGARLLFHLYNFPKPTVVACTGHALAAGALVLCASDWRVGMAGGAGKIGLNEVAIGMALPTFAIELARDRLSKRHFVRATEFSQIYGPEDAVDAGYLDEVVTGDPTEAAIARATELAALPGPAVAGTKKLSRRAVTDLVLSGLDDEMSRISGPASD